MAVKSSYKIPADIDSNYLDMEIAIKKNDIGIRPTPVRVVLTCLISIFLAYYFVFNGSSIIREGGTAVVYPIHITRTKSNNADLTRVSLKIVSDDPNYNGKDLLYHPIYERQIISVDF